MRNHFKNKWKAGGAPSVVEHLPNMHEALYLISSTANQKTKRTKWKDISVISNWSFNDLGNLYVVTMV
jgi:hypothetical protein